MYAGRLLVLHLVQAELAFVLLVAVFGSRSLCPKRVARDRQSYLAPPLSRLGPLSLSSRHQFVRNL